MADRGELVRPLTTLAGVTVGVAGVLVVQNLWRGRHHGDRDAGLRAAFALLAGVMTMAAALVVELDGPAQQVALQVRVLTTMTIAPILMRVLGLEINRRPPRWLMTTNVALCALVAVLAIGTDLYSTGQVDAAGDLVYGPLYVPLTAAIAATILVWLAKVIRSASSRWDAVVLLVAVGVPGLTIPLWLAARVGSAEVVWAVGLAPVLVAVEAVRWRTVREAVREREVASAERVRLLHALTVTNAELQQALRTRHELLDATSHELRTPLTALLGFAQTLRSFGDTLDAARRTDIVDRMSDNAERLRGVIDGMLAAQALQTTALPTLPDHVLVRPVLEAATTLFGQLDAQVSIDCAPDVTVWADPLHVPRIITSIVANAAEHGLPPVEISATSDGEVVTVLVTDHGPGIPPTFVSRLFEPFERTTSGLTRTPGGIGLGLANAAALARTCGGSLAYLPGGSGTTFEVRFPARPDAITAITTTDAPTEGGA